MISGRNSIDRTRRCADASSVGNGEQQDRTLSSGVVLVTGTTGAQGGAVARQLSALGYPVRGVARARGGATGSANAWPVVTADLTDVASAIRSFRGVSRAWVHVPLVFDAEWTHRYAVAVSQAAGTAELQQLVLVTGTRIPARPTGHECFETRRRTVATILEAGVPTTVLQPTLYLENLCAPQIVRAVAQQGVLRYPVPAQARVAWMSHLDLGAYAADALVSPPATSTVRMGGREAVTGDELAARFAKVLNRAVRYEPLDPDVFAAGLAPILGPATAAGVADTYRWIARDLDLHRDTDERLPPEDRKSTRLNSSH